jgi:hypothetical protein
MVSWSRSISLLLVLVLLLVSSPHGASSPGSQDEEQSVTFVGKGRVDPTVGQYCDLVSMLCPPTSLVLGGCNGSMDLSDTGFDSVGGGVFCDVPLGAQVSVVVDDMVSPLPMARVACPWGAIYPIYDFQPKLREFGTADPEFEGRVPVWCKPTNNGPGFPRTQVWVVAEPGFATAGTITLRVG